MSWCFHRWSKWRVYQAISRTYVRSNDKMIETQTERQRRECNKCGMTQDRNVFPKYEN